MALGLIDDSHLRNMANAIRSKLNSSDSITTSQMATKISQIPVGSGVDLSSDTVTAATLLEGYTAHDKDGNLITGTLQLSGGGDSMPIGSVIYYAGLTAPEGYLACDGTVYNIADYPDLADFFATNYSANNYWGGDGTTTFAVPDWQGEFFRASGTNSRTNQGSGASVGIHQDASNIPVYYVTAAQALTIPSGEPIVSQTNNTMAHVDSQILANNYTSSAVFEKTRSVVSGYTANSATLRPTSTSLLVCIKAVE